MIDCFVSSHVYYFDFLGFSLFSIIPMYMHEYKNYIMELSLYYDCIYQLQYHSSYDNCPFVTMLSVVSNMNKNI